MAIDNNNDGKDDVTGKSINPDGTTSDSKPTTKPTPSPTPTRPGSRRGAGGNDAPGATSVTNPNGSKVTVVAPKPNQQTPDTAWAPKVDRINPGDYIYSTGALADEVALISNPWSSAYNTWQTKSQLEGSWVRLTAQEQQLFNGIAAGRGHGSTGPGVYADMIAESVANGSAQKTPVQIALEGVQDGRLPYAASGSSGAGGSGTYRGPVTRTDYTVTDKISAHNLLNNLATDVLGRNLTDEELKKYTKKFNASEMANPSVTTSTPSGHNSVVNSTTAPTKEALAKQILQSTDEFADEAVDTKVVDMFLNRIQTGKATIHG